MSPTSWARKPISWRAPMAKDMILPTKAAIRWPISIHWACKAHNRPSRPVFIFIPLWRHTVDSAMNWSAHELTMTVLMTPDMANFSGNVHGGTILKYLDSVAYACASRYSGSYVVTLSVDQVMFLQPIHVGELVTFLASINYTGTTSMEVGIRVVTENIQQRLVRHANSCYFTMVAVDANR